MIITDKFVMLNFPKTGSSFARKVIKKLYVKTNLKFDELLTLNIRNIQSQGRIDQHGTFCQIPEKHKNKQIISIIRNPLDRLISTYVYKAWENSSPIPIKQAIKKFSNFPNLSINQFLEFQDESIEYRLGYKINAKIGIQSIQMIQMFFNDPETTLKNISLGSFLKDDLLSEMKKIKFFNQENLRNDLYEYFKEIGFQESSISFILTEKASNVTNYDNIDKSKIITNKVKNYIKQKEWFYNLVYNK